MKRKIFRIVFVKRLCAKLGAGIKLISINSLTIIKCRGGFVDN